jgi:hypothetical protein
LHILAQGLAILACESFDPGGYHLGKGNHAS